tara:strand:+ start:132 stop:842 length:711 start_codon:yes stop_codon:yes gene_type:complete
MKLRPTSPGTEYLKRNLLPLIDGIKPKTTDSWIAEVCGCDDIVSSQSIFIAMGGRIEKFWNKVITDSRDVQNCLPFPNGTDKTPVTMMNKKNVMETKNRQVDHFFTINDHEYNKHIYLESKCNLTFDTEKKPESNEKIDAVTSQLEENVGSEVQSGYYVPVKREIPLKVKQHYLKHGVPVYGVEDMFRWLNDVPFTIEEYFAFWKNTIGPQVRAKLSGVSLEEPTTTRHGGDLDAL